LVGDVGLLLGFAAVSGLLLNFASVYTLLGYADFASLALSVPAVLSAAATGNAPGAAVGFASIVTGLYGSLFERTGDGFLSFAKELNTSRVARHYFSPIRPLIHVPEFFFRTTGNVLKTVGSGLNVASHILGAISGLPSL